MPNIVYLTREQWGGGPVRAGRSAPHSQFVGLVAHHTVFILPDYDRDGFTHGDLDDIRRYMRQLQQARPDLGPDVPYSFVVFEGAQPGDAVVAEGRGFSRTGAHTEGFNSTRYGVALAGNSSTRPVTEGVLAGYRWLGQRLHNPAGAQPTIGHRDTKSTECPGHSLYAALPQIQPPFTDPAPIHIPQEDDMVIMRRRTDRASVAVIGGKLIQVTGERNAEETEKGPDIWWVDDDEWARVIEHCGPVLT